MSTLIKNEILDLARNDKIKLLGDDYDENNLESCSYDLRIGSLFQPKTSKWFLKKFEKYKKNFSNEIISKSFDKHDFVKLGPSQIITMLTLEEVNLPKNICATVFPINKNSSTGLLILNPGHIDPGYHGPISICAINLSNQDKYLTIGEKIFTIIFEKLNEFTDGYKNIEFKSRKEREIIFYKNKASKLSESMFNLITAEKYRPFLKKQINEVLNKKVYTFLVVIGLLVALIVNSDKIINIFVKNDNNEVKITKDNIKDEVKKVLESELKKKQNSIEQNSTDKNNFVDSTKLKK